MQADNERAAKRRRVESEKYHEKFFKKLFKNLLTNGKRCGIIIGSRKTRQGREICRGSLTIEQQEIKVQAKLVIENLEISLKKKSQIYHGFETYSTKYKEPNKLDKQDFNRKRFKYNLLESLILAQDERWRRA